MHHFDLKDGTLHAEGVPLELIADEAGTPVYVYSTATLKRHYGLLRAAADAHREALGEALIAFAVKAEAYLRQVLRAIGERLRFRRRPTSPPADTPPPPDVSP